MESDGIFSTVAWTVSVPSAIVYAAYTKAFAPPLHDFAEVRSPASSDAHDYGYPQGLAPDCGVSYAIVARGQLLAPDGSSAGTADIVDEYAWCVNATVESTGSGSMPPGFFPSQGEACLPFIPDVYPVYKAPVTHRQQAPPPPSGPATTPMVLSAHATRQAPVGVASVSAPRELVIRLPSEAAVCDNPSVPFARPGQILIDVNLWSGPLGTKVGSPSTSGSK